MYFFNRCLIWSAALMLVACAEPVAPPSAKLSLSVNPALEAPEIDRVRVLFTVDGVRYPATATDPSFNHTFPNGAWSGAESLLVEVLYDGATFGSSEVVYQVTAYTGNTLVAMAEGPIDLALKVVTEIVLAPVPESCDTDGDGFLDCAQAGCCDASSPFADCEPDHAIANPWGVEDACEPCGDTIDQDCSGGDEPCVDLDEDGIADCEEVDCGAGDSTRGPGLPELCDKIDNNCNGEVDEDLTLLDPETKEQLELGAGCGTGVCAGGEVVCGTHGEVICSTEALAGAEVCDGKDNDCNGQTDEVNCLGRDDMDGDGSPKGKDCNDYDAAVFPNAPESCCIVKPEGTETDEERLARCDSDCDGGTIPCEAGDQDGDGWTPPVDCDDSDPSVFPDALEACGDGIDQDCDGVDSSCDGWIDADGDGWQPPADCQDDDPNRNPGVPETCDGIDNDCDGLVDEGNPSTSDEPCGQSDEGACQLGFQACVNTPTHIGKVICVENIDPASEICDGIDNDCDGKTDEKFPELGEACDTTDSDSCANGVISCGANGLTECKEELVNIIEVCDGFDNDCNGEIDEDCSHCGDLAFSCPPDFTCSAAGACTDGSGYVFVPAGVSEMGCAPGVKNPDGGDFLCESDAEPLHEVTLSAFAIHRIEVSCGKFLGLVNPKPSATESVCPPEAENHPARAMTWDEAQSYCSALGASLCTEAQWEKAARVELGPGGSQHKLRPYPWGDTPPVCDETCWFAGCTCTGDEDCVNNVWLVDSQPAGASYYGALNMAGNVMEWVLDWYGNNAYLGEHPVDPTGPESGTEHVLRGGDYARNASYQLTYRRMRPGSSGGSWPQRTGFRCCRAVEEPPPTIGE